MVKVISLSNDAYGRLKAIKRDKSFSEVIVELVEKKQKKNIMDFFGIWVDNAKEWENIKKEIYNDRKKSKLREFKW